MLAKADTQMKKREQATAEANNLRRGELTPALQKAMDLARERGSSWLTALPLEEHGGVSDFIMMD